MAINSRFSFVGKLVLPRDLSSFYFEAEDGSRVSIGFNVAEGEQNRGWVEAVGFKNKTVKTRSKDGNNLEIDWDERLNPAVVNDVAGGSKFYVDLGEDFGGSNAFVSKYDMIKFLADKLPTYNGNVTVKGMWEKNPWKGNIKDRFTITSVYAANPDVKPALTLDMALFYNTDSIDNTDFKDSQKIYVNGYIEQYVRAEGKRMLFPQQAILSQTAYNTENPRHMAKWNVNVSYLKEKLPKKKKMAHIHWSCRLVNGAEEVSFDESMLTTTQLEMIECGLATIDDFKPKSRVFGSKVTEIRLNKPVLTGEYVDGPVECDETLEEIEERVFRFTEEESLEDVLNKTEKPKENLLKSAVVESDDDEEDDDLF